MKGKDAVSLAIILVLTFLLFTFIALRVTGHVTPLLTVKSGSMYPTLKVGDVILMEPVSPKDIKVGDVIIFYKPGTRELIVHRVVMKTDEGLYTKGDANPSIDWWSPLPYENVVGKWTGFKIPYWLGIGYLSLFFSGELYPPYGKLTLIGLILLNIALIAKDIFEQAGSSEKPKSESGEAESSQGEDA